MRAQWTHLPPASGDRYLICSDGLTDMVPNFELYSTLLMVRRPKKAFDDLALKKLPTVKSLQAEYSDLLVQKKLDYAELSKARDEAKRLQIYKANAEMLLRTDADDQRQTREHQQEK